MIIHFRAAFKAAGLDFGGGKALECGGRTEAPPMMVKGTLGLLLVLVLAGPAVPQDPAGLIAAGDSLYEQREDPSQAKMAVERYREASRADPGSYDARWKAAKALFYIGRVTEEGGKAKARTFADAIAEAKEAVRLGPGRVEGHFWLAACYGEYGQARGVLKSLALRDDILRELNAAIRIDETFDCGAVYVALGRIYFKVPRFFGGSLAKSRAYLEKAGRYCSRTTTNLLYLAETYWALGERDLAVRTLERLLEIEPYPAVLPEGLRDKADAAKLLEAYRRR
jgi:tetratricopeptide (TPR) repeat protein